jgi:hypothetical protein
MYVLYLDDSGSAPNLTEEFLVLGGVAVFERRIHFITEELDNLAARFDPTNPGSVEFHASAEFSGKVPPWNTLKDKPARQKVIKDVLGVLADDRYGTNAFAVAVHKPSFPNSDPMQMAFEELCNRFDIFLKAQNSQLDQHRQQRGMIVIDESAYETTLQKLARDFRKFGTRWGVTRNLAEVPLFADSRACRTLQLADHLAYAVFRYFEAKDMNYIDVILNKFHADDQTGKIHGLVHKQSNRPNCPCHACMSRR